MHACVRACVKKLRATKGNVHVDLCVLIFADHIAGKDDVRSFQTDVRCSLVRFLGFIV